MQPTVSNAFIKEFSTEVHLEFQRIGSKLRNTVRTKSNVKGSSVIFQKIGKGVASTKVRHGKIPVMNLEHKTAEAILQDYYAGEWIDKLDEIKENHDEQRVVARAGAYALGRKTDELIMHEFNKSNNRVGRDNDGLTKEKILKAFEKLGEKNVPDDGERYAIIGWKQWSELLSLPEFANTDYVGQDDLPWKGTQAKRWLGTLWMPHAGLTKDSSNRRHCYWYHKTAVGYAIGQEVTSDFTWHGDRAAHFVNNMMSMGACLIDPTGVISMRCLES